MNRLQKKIILKDIEKKLVFIVGPRQVGKTWLAKDIGKDFNHVIYLNYDNIEDRKIIKNASWLTSKGLLILDEIHKMPDFKNYLKGIYDTKDSNLKMIVTGSARLDFIRQSGDSMAGRFYTHRLLPLSPAEVIGTEFDNNIERFMERGGFPEPFLASDIIDSKRWRMQYIDGLIRNDILDLGKINDFKAIQTVLELLRERVGSPLSYSSIAQDVAISPNTVKKYIQIFEALYIIFKITPYSKNIARSLLKEPKVYFYDIGMVKSDQGVIFENMVALSLLNYVYTKIDQEGKNYALHYFRTKEGKEIDFCIVEDNKPQCIIETKLSDSNPSQMLTYFNERYQIKALQIVKELRHEKNERNIEVRRGIDYLKQLI
ncbi:MAG: ATP-binding protein [Desulfobacterales bacterium]|nr:ATP-binding protein [Desulfobacterales bacterium]MBF0395798.1 ATP-binding protein [Desulfobacterales bacterium]